MAANKMQFQYEITANTSQAKRALADLDKALDRLNKQQKLDMGLSQELTEAADAARLLQRELNAAMDVKTGKLNVSELVRGLAQAGSSVEQLSTKFLNAGAMGEAAFRGLAQSIVAADVPLKKMNKTLFDAMTTLKNTVKWEMSSTLVHGLEGAFSGAVSYAKNLNTSLTNIRIVTNQSIDDMVKFTKQANAAAKELSTTTKAYADASLIYYQQGDSQELAAKKAAITIKAANSSFETSAKEMSEYLTSVWNSYQVGTDELEHYVDIMANLGAKTATSLEEIATSMQKVAATANTVGVSMEQVSSIIATVSSVTRESAESIGTSYKTIFARIGDLKLGKVDEDGVGLGQVSSQLDDIGVKILDETGNLREMGDIIMDLGTKWQTMNQAQKTAVAQVVAGKRQYTQLMALFENWDMFQSNMNIAENSEGALQNMADIYAESWEAASARVKASMEGIFNQIINDQAIIKITNVLADLTDGIGGVIKGMGGLGGVLTSIGSIATAVFKDKMIVGVNNITKTLGDFKKSFDGKKGKDIFSSFLGESTALRAYKKDLADLNNELSKQKTDSETDNFVNKNMQAVISAKQKLLDIESQLTSAERERYQMSINSVNVGINDVKEQSEAYDEQKKSIDRLIKSQVNLEAQQEALHRVDPSKTVASDDVKKQMSDRIDALYKKDSDVDMQAFNVGPVFDDMEEVLDKVDDPLQALLQRFQQLTQVMEATADASQGLEDIDKHLETTDAEQNLQRLVTILENFQSQLKETGAKTEQIDTILSGLKNGTLDVREGLEQATTAMTLYKNAGKSVETTTTILTTKLGVAEGALEELKEQSSRSISMFRRMQASMKDVAQAADDMLSGKGGKGSLGEKFTKIAQGATSAVSAFSTWSSVTKNWDGMSVSESLGSIAELVTDIATSGSLFGAAATAIGAGVGFIFGAIEKQVEEARENIQKINENIIEQAEELDKSSQAADQAVKNFDEASKAWNEGSLGQNEYLTIIDNVLEALDQEHLKVYALTNDYETLYDKIHQANQERMQGEIQKAQNLITTGYNTLDESLDGYNGPGSASLWGNNGVKIDESWRRQIIAKLGLVSDDPLGSQALRWSGKEEDLPKLYSNWENLQTSQEQWAINFRTVNNGKDFSNLSAYMEQFTPVFNALETWSQMSANFALSNLDINKLDPTTIRDTIFNTIYSSLNTTEATATSHQKEMAKDIAENWITNLSEDLQLGFYQAYNKEIANQSAEETFKTITGAGKLKVSEDVSLPTHWLSLNTDDNTFYNGMDPRIYADIQKMITYKGLANQAAKNDTALIPSLLAQMGISEQNASDVGINLQDGQSLNEYLSTASDSALNIILGQIQGYIDGVLFNTSWDLEDKYPDSGWTMENWEQKYSETIAWIDKTWQNAIDNHIDSLSKNDQLKNSINELTIDPITGQPVISADSFIEHFTSNIEEYAKLYGQIKLDEKGNLTSESQAEIENSVFAQMEENTAYIDLMLAMVEGGIFDFKAFFERLQAFQTEKDKILAEPLVPEIDFDNTSSTDFKTLTGWGSDYTKWDEDEMQQFKRMAMNYGTNIDDWYAKTEGQKSQDVYNVAEKAFNKQYETIPDKSDEAGYATYLETLSQLREFATQATKGAMEDLETNFSNVQSVLGTLMSLDLSKEIDETVVSAEQFSEIMGMSIKDFNSQYSTASQKQLALLQAQEKASSNYADELATQANNWLEAVGGQDALAKDANLMQTWAILSQQVSSAQADAAQSAQNVNAAYATLNNEAVAGIAAQWERANKEAEKQQQIANILSSSVESGIISNEEAAIVGITAAEWAGYTTEVRAAKAASATIAANNATIEALNNEKTAVAGAIEYLDKYKNAWNQHVLNDGDFNRALNSSFSAGDFGEGDEAIAKMKEFREAREQAIANVGSTDADKVLTEMSIILGIDKTELESQIKQVAGSGKDAVNSIFSTMSQELQQKAQDAVDAWQGAFDKIAAAREKLASGGSLLEDIAGDPEALIFYAQQLGMSVEEAYNKIVSGMIDESQLKMPEFDLENAKAIYGLDKGIGQSREKDAMALGYEESDLGTDAFQAKVIPYYQKILMASGKYTQDAALELATSIAKGTASYDAIAEGASQVAAALPLAADAAEVFAQSNITAAKVEYAADTANIQYNEDGTIVGTSTYAMVNGQTGTYDEYQKLATAIANAQEAKASGESWETLSQADQDLLAKYDINFDNVDESANTCATALAACAEAAYNLAMAAAGEGYKYVEELGYHVNEYGQQDDTSKALDTAYEQKESARQNVSDVNRKTTELHAESADFSYEELEEYTQALIDNNKIIEESKEKQMELASEVAKQEKALDKAKSSYKDWMKVLKDSNSTSEQVSSTVEEMREVYEDLFHLTEDESGMISSEFLKSAENAELLEEAIKGNEDAWDKLKAAVAKDIFAQANLGDQMDAELSSLADTIAAYDFEANGIKVGASVETADFYSVLDDMVFASYDTAERVSAGLSSLGVEAQLVPHSEPLGEGQAKVSPTGSLLVPTISPDGTITYEEVAPQGSYTISADGGLATYWTIEGATYNGAGVTRPSGGGGGSSGGGGNGGGGSNKKEKKKHKRTKDHVERYHENNEVLKRIGEELEKIDKLKDRTYGKNHVDQLDAETEALKDQAAAYKALQAEAEGYAQKDRNSLADLGATFDADGNINNYEELIKSIVDTYNQAVDTYNNSSQNDGDKEDLEEAEQAFDDAMKLIEDYEEALAQAAEAGTSLKEVINQISEIKLEKITYELEVKLDLNERDVKLLEYYSKKYEEYLDKQDEVFNNTINKALEYQEDLNHLYTAYDQLVAEYMNGTLTEADYTQGLQDIQDQIVDKLSDLNDIQNQLAEVYENTLSMAAEEIGKLTSALDENNSVLQSYMDILNLLSTHGTDYEAMDFFYNKMNENNLHNIGIQRDAYNLLLKEEDKFQQILAERGKLTELEQKEYDSLQEKIREAKQTLVTTTEEAMQLLRSQYENTIASIANSLFDFSEIGAHSLEHLQDQYGYFQEQQERYVSTAKALTEVSKLNRDIEGQLAQSVSASSKQALKDLQAKINKQNELNKMTEYDIEMNQLQYQLLLARIKLEEAENAKDVVRLTRDDNGNYAYQYTANQDKLDEAAQNYEDVLQQINDSTAQRTSEIEQRILDTMANYKEKLQEVATDYSLSEEERYARMEELSARFKETMYYLDEEYQKATNNLGENQAAMAKHYGMSVEEISKGTAGTFNESIKTMMGSMNTYVQSVTNAFGKDSDFTKAWETLQNGMTELSRASGLTFGSMVEDTEEMATEEQSMVAQAEKLLSMLDDSLEPIGKATTAWQTHAGAIQTAIDKYESLAKLIQDVLGAMSGYGNTTPTTSSTTSNSSTTSVPVNGHHAKGGLADYTGLGWLDGTEADPELVLNPEDTHNMLKIVDTVRKIDPDSLATLMEAYKINLASMYASLNMMNMSSIMSQHKTSDVLEQYVTITAEFPNASDRNEIKEVFDGLVNRAAQFAKRKK